MPADGDAFVSTKRNVRCQLRAMHLFPLRENGRCQLRAMHLFPLREMVGAS